MKRKVVVVLFFVVVFGLPIVWYLFLQIFGENKFDLPKIEQWDQTCLPTDQAAVVIDPSLFGEFPNELKRINRKLAEQVVIGLEAFSVQTCSTPYDFYLVDEDGWVRGQFEVSREEVDRLLAEIDIYLLNKRNESGN